MKVWIWYSKVRQGVSCYNYSKEYTMLQDRGCGNIYVPQIGDTVQYRAQWSGSGTWEGTIFNLDATFEGEPAVRIATQDPYGQRVNTTIVRTRIIQKVGEHNYRKS